METVARCAGTDSNVYSGHSWQRLVVGLDDVLAVCCKVLSAGRLHRLTMKHDDNKEDMLVHGFNHELLIHWDLMNNNNIV